MTEGTERDDRAANRLMAKGAVAKVKRKKIVAKRFIKANLFLLPLLVVVPNAYRLTQPERAPLPYDATSKFDAQRQQIQHLTESKINVRFLVDESIDADCSKSYLDAPNTFHLSNVNKVASSIRLNSREVKTFQTKNNQEIDTYFTSNDLTQSDEDDEGTRQGEFMLFVVILEQGEKSRLPENVEKQIVLGEKRHGWIFLPHKSICGVSSLSKLQDIVTALHDYLQNPGQHLPTGVEVLYPSYHITLSLLLEKPSEKSQLHWNEVESSGSISGLRHQRSRMKRLGKFLKVINEKIVSTPTRPNASCASILTP